MHPHSPNNHESRPRWSRAQRTRIGVIGAGELGLSTATELAERGYQVVWAGGDVERAASELPARARHNARAGRLHFTSSRAAAARFGHVIVMAVATQPGERGISTLLNVAVEIAHNLTGPTVIVDESTDSAAAAVRIARAMAGSSNHEIVVVRGTRKERAGCRSGSLAKM